jgi:hypothetical protein
MMMTTLRTLPLLMMMRRTMRMIHPTLTTLLLMKKRRRRLLQRSARLTMSLKPQLRRLRRRPPLVVRTLDQRISLLET